MYFDLFFFSQSMAKTSDLHFFSITCMFDFVLCATWRTLNVYIKKYFCKVILRIFVSLVYAINWCIAITS